MIVNYLKLIGMICLSFLFIFMGFIGVCLTLAFICYFYRIMHIFHMMIVVFLFIGSILLIQFGIERYKSLFKYGK